ncbi:MAG: hypothetical protein ACK55Z_31425, partial [bacterium]
MQANEAFEGATELPGGDGKVRGDSACRQAPSGAGMGLADSNSEVDTTDPGGMPRIPREPCVLNAGLLETLRRLRRRWTATCGIAHKSHGATEPQAKVEGPARLKDRECRTCQGEGPGVS